MERFFLTHLNNWVFQEKRKPLILRGARQVGKSTLVNIFAKQKGLKLLEINLERHRHLDKIFATLDMSAIIEALEAIFKSSVRGQNNLLFLDEIQATPHAIAALRYFYEDTPEIPVIAAGSLIEFVLADHNFSMPVGRIEYGFLGPMSFEEFLQAGKEAFLLEKVRSFSFDKSWSAQLHDSLITKLRDYLFVGGMPEVVNAFVQGEPKSALVKLQRNIVDTYQDDFSKYAKQVELTRLQEVYQKLPSFIGKKIKFSELLPGERSTKVKQLFNLLQKAGVVDLAYHSDCQGIPLTAQIDHSVFKPYWVDVGLLNQMLGLSWDQMSRSDKTIMEGPLAEQFVAQELACWQRASSRGPLCYWLREGKQTNAKVDFVIQRGSQILPIEVKSGASGTLKSLLQMAAEKNIKAALRVDLNPPSRQTVKHNVVTPKGKEHVQFELFNVPLYLLSQFLKSATI